MNDMGTLYDKGTGVPKNPYLAYLYYLKAAQKGFDIAIYNVGCCYENGEGVTRNPKTAVKYYKRAADRGNRVAKEALIKLQAELEGKTEEEREGGESSANSSTAEDSREHREIKVEAEQPEAEAGSEVVPGS